MDWEWNGSDAIIERNGGDIAFSPINDGGRAVTTGYKRAVLDSNNDTVAGWTARSRGNQAYSLQRWGTITSHQRYGGTFSVSDSLADRLGRDLRPCT